jgi:DNA-binding transcriptional regulator PaaX
MSVAVPVEAEVRPDELVQAEGQSAGRRPQALVFSFFGGVVVGRDLPPIPTAVFLRLFGELGVTEAAVRATLARMTRKGLLERIQTGRAAHYRLTPTADALVRRAAVRVTSPAPFEHPDGEWTLLSYSLPESRRDLRHQLRAALTWAGFGSLRHGLWIAPGTVDVGQVFDEAGLTGLADHAEWFAASPMAGVRIEELISRAWPVERIRHEHEQFIAGWWSGPHDEEPLSQVTRLGADWLRLLRVDPGLPARYLSADWPAAQSAAVYSRCYESLLPAARRSLDLELGHVVPG